MYFVKRIICRPIDVYGTYINSKARTKLSVIWSFRLQIYLKNQCSSQGRIYGGDEGDLPLPPGSKSVSYTHLHLKFIKLKHSSVPSQ